MRLAALALLALAVLASGCGDKKPEDELGREEPVREGLALELDGIEYNVFITRQLNLSIPPDSAYYKGPPPKKGETFYGVFIEACNQGAEPRQTASSFAVKDNQGNEFEPTELPEDNDFAYHPKVLEPKRCIPEAGSVAQEGSTGGALLLFKLPLSATENRPLELEVEGGVPVETAKVELDL